MGQASQDPKIRLFCFPYAGGSAQVFRNWQDHLPEIEVCPVDIAGRGKLFRKPLLRDLPSMVHSIMESLLPQITGPFILFGHSMGALISFEVARELRRRGLMGPLHLLVSGRQAPQIEDQNDPKYKLPDAEFIAELRRLDGTPDEVLDNPELMKLVLPLLRSDFELVHTYKYRFESPLSCPITAYGGIGDQDVTIDDLRSWQAQTSSTFSLKMFPGSHFFIHSSGKKLIETVRLDILTAPDCPLQLLMS
jgi:medium-chain acyl-[acyl-carrier-protein] hydrolase